MILPSIRRTTKIARIACIIEIFLFVLIGIAGYISLGDENMIELFLFRPHFNGISTVSKWTYNLLLMAFFLTCLLSLSIFNPTLR